MEESRNLTQNSFQTGAETLPGHLSFPDTEMVKTGAEAGVSRFFEQAFVNPDSAKQGAQALLRAFNDSGMWLSSLVQPQHLVAELRQGCCIVTHGVVTQWTRQGETHKLVKLAEALMEAKPPVLTHEAGQVMALLAGLLGILRPTQAPRWLEMSVPLLRDSVDPHLLKEGTQWVKIGQLLASLPLEDRLFWNRRLREPEDEWEWDSPEALDALERVAPVLDEANELIFVFQAVLPACWLELWKGHRQAASQKVAKVEAKKSLFPTFAGGMLAGMAGISLLGLSLGWVRPNQMAVEEKEESPASFSFYQVDSSATSVPATAKSDSSPVASSGDVKEKKQAPAPVSASMQARLEAAAKIGERMPELERLHNLVKMGTLREATPHIFGRTTMASQGSREHRGLLRWLMLDPPKDPEVRESVAKAAVRVLGTVELYETLKLCMTPDSPNLKEAKECASLLLALGGENLDVSQKTDLSAMAAVGTAK